eukprot:2873603-Pleurochrysis_carterae.AAC.1
MEASTSFAAVALTLRLPLALLKAGARVLVCARVRACVCVRVHLCVLCLSPTVLTQVVRRGEYKSFAEWLSESSPSEPSVKASTRRLRAAFEIVLKAVAEGRYGLRHDSGTFAT